jgi:hypothetical protein
MHYNKVGSTGPPVLQKLGTKGDVVMKVVHMKKKQGTKLVFSPKLVFRGVSPQVLDIPNQRLGYCPFPSLNQALLNLHN